MQGGVRLKDAKGELDEMVIAAEIASSVGRRDTLLIVIKNIVKLIGLNHGPRSVEHGIVEDSANMMSDVFWIVAAKNAT